MGEPGRRAVLGAAGALAIGVTLAGEARAAAPAPEPGAGAGVGDYIGQHPGTVLRPGPPEQAGLLPEYVEKTVAALESYRGPSPKYPYYPGYTVLAARNGTVVLHEAHGKAVKYRRYDLATDTGIEFPPEQQIDAAVDTVWDLASCTKLFTSICAVRELEEGHLQLEAPAAQYLPEYGRAGKEVITIRQLLTHTSGLEPDLKFFDEPDEAARRELLYAAAPQYAPGSTYQYSDLNLITLQWVLERITGRALDDLVRERITEPLGLAHTRFNPPPSWKPKVAAQEDEHKPWARVDRGLVWGEVHDENAWSFGGVAGHAGLFSTARDMAVLGQALLNGGVYGGRRILQKSSVELMFTNFNQAFPGDDHGLGFELYQFWYMGTLATPFTAGHTGFTGTSLVLDPTTGTVFTVLSNSVHPCRNWRSGSGPRYAAGTQLGRAVPVRPRRGRTAWYSGNADAAEAVLELPPLAPGAGAGRLEFDLWFDTEPGSDFCRLEASPDGKAYAPLPFRAGSGDHPDGSLDGWGGRTWLRAAAALPAGTRQVRWRYTTDPRYTGRGVYVDAITVRTGGKVVFDDSRPADASRIHATGWTPSTD